MLKWTREPPKVAGRYYTRTRHDGRRLPMVRVIVHKKRGLVWLPEWVYEMTIETEAYGPVAWAALVATTTCEWAGPIPEPEEASDE